MLDLAVVGAGIFGSVLGRYAQRAGLAVTWVDNEDPRSASLASGGLFKPEWFSTIKGERFDRGMAVVASMASVRELALTVPLVRKTFTVQQITPESLMVPASDPARRTGHVEAVGPGWVRLRGGEELTARLVVVAAGVGTTDIVGSGVVVHAKVGVAFRWPKRDGEPSLFQLWAPYKQTIVCDMGDGTMWGGDGTALKPETFSRGRMDQCAARVGKLARWTPEGPRVTRLVGHRPYVPGVKGGWLREVQPRVWTLTGGGKIGTVAAGVHAYEWAEQAGVA